LVADDLPEAWSFLDSSLHCELQHGVAGYTIVFSYPYVDGFYDYSYMVEYDEQGTRRVLCSRRSRKRRTAPELGANDDPDVIVETHTTRMGIEATKFLACVDVP
jgi:hypothetical protein